MDALVDHRMVRERQVLDAVRGGLGEIPAIVALLYADVDEKLHKPAGRSVLAHLGKLVDESTVVVVGGGPPRLKATYAPVVARHVVGWSTVSSMPVENRGIGTGRSDPRGRLDGSG